MPAGKWNIANLISLYRIVAIPALLGMIIYEQRSIFTVLLIISLLSDIADGVIARAFKLQTELGARLDSIGDMGTYIVSVIGLFTFEFQFLKDYYLPVGAIVLLYISEAVISIIKFGKISSFHTVLCKIAAYAQGIFMVSLFLNGLMPWIFYTAVVISAIAYMEEIAIVFTLPQNSSNVKGLRHAWNIRRGHDI